MGSGAGFFFMLSDDITQLIPTIQPVLRPFHSIPIKDCGEKLADLAAYGVFAFENPHPYVKAGATYGNANPFMLRQGVADKLAAAARALAAQKPGWKIKVFDAYRPVAVQKYMVAYSFMELARDAGIDPLTVSGAEKDELLARVYHIWAPPNTNPLTPPPHSTGAALDITLLDETGRDVEMGSPIDLNGPESAPDYFADKNPTYHANREFLNALMTEHGFLRNPREWWHFSYGDQFWTWLKNGQQHTETPAIYGRVE